MKFTGSNGQNVRTWILFVRHTLGLSGSGPAGGGQSVNCLGGNPSSTGVEMSSAISSLSDD